MWSYLNISFFAFFCITAGRLLRLGDGWMVWFEWLWTVYPSTPSHRRIHFSRCHLEILLLHMNTSTISNPFSFPGSGGASSPWRAAPGRGRPTLQTVLGAKGPGKRKGMVDISFSKFTGRHYYANFQFVHQVCWNLMSTRELRKNVCWKKCVLKFKINKSWSISWPRVLDSIKLNAGSSFPSFWMMPLHVICLKLNKRNPYRRIP